MIKAITFDLDGVYFLNGKENFIKNIVALGVSEQEARRVFLQSDEMNNLYKTGKWSDDQFWDWAIQEWRIKSTPKEIVDLLIKGYSVNEEVADTVKKARAKGYKTLICSNNFQARIKGLQERFGFLDDFDVVILACEVGYIKPGPEIFEALIDKSGVQPSEIFYADDFPAALDTAKKLGIQTHFYTNFEDFIQTLKNLGVNL